MVNARSSKIVGKTKDVNDFTHRKFRMPERAHVKEKWWGKNEKHPSMVEWHTFLGFYFPKESKCISQKLVASTIQILGCHTLPISCNNQPNQFLAVINYWVNKTRKVVYILMGSPFEIWPFPIGPKVWISPPLILRKSCPSSLLLHWHRWLWVFLIEMHIYMVSNIIMCQLAQNTINNDFNRQNIKW